MRHGSGFPQLTDQFYGIDAVNTRHLITGSAAPHDLDIPGANAKPIGQRVYYGGIGPATGWWHGDANPQRVAVPSRHLIPSGVGSDT